VNPQTTIFRIHIVGGQIVEQILRLAEHLGDTAGRLIEVGGIVVNSKRCSVAVGFRD
jgi:3-phosphoglycerate kinase